MVSNDCFISYRRATSEWVARAVFQDLRANRINAFLDVESIDAGEFRNVIDVQIRQRPYFLPIFTPAALRRCLEPDDLLLKELDTGVAAERHIVPLVTAAFDRNEIKQCLPEPLADRYLSLNTVNLEHEYFEASMSKLRNRFLKPVETTSQEIDPSIAQHVERLTEAAAAKVPIGQTALSAQKHFEQAFATAADQPELAVAEFGLGSDLLQRAPQARLLLNDVDLMFLELQTQLQRENTKFELISNLLKARHEKVKRAISSIR